MKKTRQFLLVAVMLFVSFIVAACGDNSKEVKYEVTFNTHGGTAVETIEVKEDSTFALPSTSKEGFEFAGWYLEDTYETEFVSGTKVTKDITLHAKWNEVAPTTQVFVYTVSPREEFVLFENNKAEKANKRTEFMNREMPYIVGDDNAWIVKPVVSFIELDVETGEIVNSEPVVDSWNYAISLELMNQDTGEYAPIDNETYVESMDTMDCTIDFTDAAIDQMFRVTVVPEGLSEKQQQNIADYTVQFEFAVADGYNAYTALDLAYIENRGEDNSTSGEEWVKFKNDKGLDVKYAPAGIYLHDNIEVTVKDVPQYFFYTKEEVAGAVDAARAEGSLKDNKNIYLRYMEKDEIFMLHGNYFTISAASIPVVVRENEQVTEEGAVISHTTFLRFESAKDDVVQGNVIVSSTNLVGNAPRVEDAIKSGGLIFNKTEDVTFTAVNNIAYAWFIIYMPNVTDTLYLVDSCKGYDSYNSLIYNWGSAQLVIQNSEFVGAGGPVIIQDHVDSTEADGGDIAKTIVKNSKLESYVSGTEGWFVGVGASAIVPGIKALDALFNPFGRSFLKSNKDGTVTYFNLICVNKSGDAESITAQKIKGSLAINEYSVFDFGATNPYLAGLLDTTFAMGAPAFQTSSANLNNGIAYGTNTGLFDIQQKQILDPSNGIYQGEYICMYYNGMGLTLGYNQYSPTDGYEIFE